MAGVEVIFIFNTKFNNILFILIGIFLVVFFCTLPAYCTEDLDNLFISPENRDVYTKLDEMENFYYGHNYPYDVMEERLCRLEKTVFKFKRKNLSSQQRFIDIYKSYKSKSSPFYLSNKAEPLLSESEMVVLDLMENRVFGKNDKTIPLKERISRLELAILGVSNEGNLQSRYKYLCQSTPISIKGIKISQNGETVASFKPDYKSISVPIPECPNKKIFTPIDIDYNTNAGDYFLQVAKNSSGEILRWKDFPLYVFINSNDPSEINASKNALENWQIKVPIYITSNYEAADILIDWASKSDYVTVPFISREKGSKQIKVLINMLNVKKDEQKTILVAFIMHQIGHALGLWGHSDNPTDLMYPVGTIGINDINLKNKVSTIYQTVSLETKRAFITDRDMNTLYQVYQTPSSFDKILSNW